MQGEIGPVICPRYGRSVELADPVTGGMTAQWEPFSDALAEWMAGGPGEVASSRCRQAAGLND